MENIFSKEMSRISNVLEDLLLIFSSPRSFFQKLQNESLGYLVRRLILYYFCFDLVILALFYPIAGSASGITPFTLFIISLVEILIAFIHVPAFLISSRISSPKIPIRLAIVYPLIAKVIFLIPSIVAYAAYLLSENTVFIFIRGSLVYAYFLVICLLFPYISLKKTKRRLLVVLVSLVSVIGINILTFTLVTNFYKREPSDRYKAMMIIFDPIGCELENKVLTFDYEIEEITFTIDMIQDIINAAEPHQDGYFLGASDVKEISERYKNNLKNRKIRFDALKNELTDVHKNLKFATNKNIVGLFIEEVDIGLETIELSNQLSDDLSGLINIGHKVAKNNVNYVNKHIEYMESLNNALSIRIMAMRLGMLYF